jgi:hypothetical protein
MKRSLLILLSFFWLVSCGPAKVYDYEIHCIKTGENGLQIVKVYSYGKTVEKASTQCKKNAVHGAIFKGISGGSCSPNPPIVGMDKYESNKAYFDEFFSSGKYLQFVTLSGDGSIAPNDRLKTSDGYKVGLPVVVRYDALRKKLENDGIARALNQGF